MRALNKLFRYRRKADLRDFRFLDVWLQRNDSQYKLFY